MRIFTTHRSSPSLLFLVFAALVVSLGARAEAQVSPLWDHYKVYKQNPPITVGPFPIGLVDQFGPYTHDVLALELFANPVEKHLPPPGGEFLINDPLLHYTWWRISPQPFNGIVTANNQFGDHTLNVHDAEYLWNPALKNQPGSPPQKNHYKCYRCDGPPVERQVFLLDQFDSLFTTVMFPRYFCNPVAKSLPGANYPIVDPKQHYICYDLQPPDPNPFTAMVTDQFVDNRPLDLHPGIFLCVPTDKTGVTATRPSTWGRMKMLYR